MSHVSCLKRRGFTLIELLVVIAIIAVLVGLLLPAVQKVRESAARARCTSQLKQLALAMANYEASKSRFPPGVSHPGHNGRFTSAFVEILPFIEQDNVYRQWNFTNPGANFDATDKPGASPIPLFVCPSAGVNQNPLSFGTVHAGVSTYGLNGGTKSFPSDQARADGMFHEVGPTAKPKATQRPVKVADVTDGLSNTLLLAERNPGDGNLDSWQTAPVTPTPDPPRMALSAYCVWGTPLGQNASATILLSSAGGANFGFPVAYIPPTPPTPPTPGDWNTLGPDWYRRVTAIGSRHVGGANAAMTDGSVRFVSQTINAPSFTALMTREGGETVTE